MILRIIDKICAWLIYVELFAIPIMVMYYLFSNQTVNWVIGFLVGAIVAWWVQGKILQAARIWIYSSASLLTAITFMMIVKLSHKL